MKIIENCLIPFKGFKAINLFGILFTRDKSKLTDVDINHEEIHTAQIKEMLYIVYYIWYIIEWLIKLFKYNNAYRNISFEREAYTNEKDFNYLSNRKHYAWFKMI